LRRFLAPVCFFVDLLRFCSLVTISQGKKISVHRGSTAVVSLEKFQENTSTSLEFASFACSLSVSKDPMGDVSLNRPIKADPPAGGIAKVLLFSLLAYRVSSLVPVISSMSAVLLCT